MKDLRKMEIEHIALKLAWADLDDDDHRIYLREAEKAYNKKKTQSFEDFSEEIDNTVETMNEPNYVSRADSSVYLPKKKSKKRK